MDIARLPPSSSSTTAASAMAAVPGAAPRPICAAMAWLTSAAAAPSSPLVAAASSNATAASASLMPASPGDTSRHSPTQNPRRSDGGPGGPASAPVSSSLIFVARPIRFATCCPLYHLCRFCRHTARRTVLSTCRDLRNALNRIKLALPAERCCQLTQIYAICEIASSWQYLPNRRP